MNNISTTNSYKNIGYFYCKDKDITEVNMTRITHLNISFGLIYHNENSNLENDPALVISEEKLHTIYLPGRVVDALNKIPELKRQNPNLIILLSVGGWGCKGFSGAALTEESRRKFASSCLQVIDLYNLDGVDIDWEYPVDGGGGLIASCPEDKENFTLLLKNIRSAIGTDKLLTAAGAGFGYICHWTNPFDYAELLDYMNIMTYDFAFGGMHNANLYPSQIYSEFNYLRSSLDEFVNLYLEHGFKAENLNLGIPFYGRVPSSKFDAYRRIAEAHSFDGEKTYISYEAIIKNMLPSGCFKENWDPSACASYLTAMDPENGNDEFVLSYDSPKAIKFKTDYIKKMNLGGAMFWEFSEDNNNELVSVIASELHINAVPTNK
jgi:chitinase